MEEISSSEYAIDHRLSRLRWMPPEEIDKWTKFAQVLYTAVLGLHFEREVQEKNGQLAIF